MRENSHDHKDVDTCGADAEARSVIRDAVQAAAQRQGKDISLNTLMCLFVEIAETCASARAQEETTRGRGRKSDPMPGQSGSKPCDWFSLESFSIVNTHGGCLTLSADNKSETAIKFFEAVKGLLPPKFLWELTNGRIKTLRAEAQSRWLARCDDAYRD